MTQGITYAVNLGITNTGSLTWDSEHSQFPVQVRYRWKDSAGNVVEQYGNFGLLAGPVVYSQTANMTLLIRAPLLETLPANLSVLRLEIDLEEWGTTLFSERGVAPVTQKVSISDAPLPDRPTLDVTKMPFGVGGPFDYNVVNEPVPDVVTVCSTTQNLIRLDENDRPTTIVYSVPYGRSLHNIHDLWVDSHNNAYYEVDYGEYVNTVESLYLFKQDVAENERCPEEQNYSARPCEDIFIEDLSGVDAEMCLDLAKAYDRNWVSGYEDKTFKPNNPIDNSEFAKIIVEALGLDIVVFDSTTSLITDITWDESLDEKKPWYADYAYTAVVNGIMETDAGQFNPDDEVSFAKAVAITMRMFNFNVNNPCDYQVLYPSDPYIGAALFYGVIEKEGITEGAITRGDMVQMMVNAEAQKDNISGTTLLCPNTPPTNIPQPTETKEICSDTEQVKLSSSQAIELEGNLLINGTKVTVLNDLGHVFEIEVNSTAETGYVAAGNLSDFCTTPTPLEALKTPDDGEVVVATPFGIYAHIEPSILANYVDVNGNGSGNATDLIPYNAILTALEARGNWLKVRFTETDKQIKVGWIYRGFIEEGTNLPQRPIALIKQRGVIAWAHGMTVDLRMYPVTDINKILWESYEETTVQVIEQNPPFYFVKIEAPARNLDDKTIQQNYAGRLYQGVIDLNKLQIGLSGWVHQDFIKIDGETYDAPFAYPFDYEAAKSASLAEQGLINLNFFEEIFGEPLHYGIDYNLPEGTAVQAANDGELVSAEKRDDGLGNTVVIKHAEDRYSVYAHLKDIGEDLPQPISKGTEIGSSGGTSSWDGGSKRPHLHFSVQTDNELRGYWQNALNPTKYIAGYDASDAHQCVKGLIVDAGIRDSDEIVSKCQIGIGGNNLKMILELNVVGSGDGNIDVVNRDVQINCSTNSTPCTYEITANSTITLKLEATKNNDDSIFVGWDGACKGTSSCIIRISETQSVLVTVTAKFESLLNKFSPIMAFYSDDYFPSPINAFLDYAILYKRGSKNAIAYGIKLPDKIKSIRKCDAFFGAQTVHSSSSFVEDISEKSRIGINDFVDILNNADGDYFLDFVNRNNGGRDYVILNDIFCSSYYDVSVPPYEVMKAYPHAIYGRVYKQGERTYLQYYFFYLINAWNDDNEGIGGYHEGDWEGMVIELDEENNPLRVGLSQHLEGETQEWNKVPNKIGEHPIVYIGRGGHPTYFDKGTKGWATDYLWVDHHDKDDVIIQNKDNVVDISSINAQATNKTYWLINIETNKNVKKWLMAPVYWGLDWNDLMAKAVASPGSSISHDPMRWNNPKKWLDDRE